MTMSNHTAPPRAAVASRRMSDLDCDGMNAIAPSSFAIFAGTVRAAKY